MKARAILQINKATGQKMLTLTQDEHAPTEDFLVRGGGWSLSDVFTAQVLVFTDNKEIEDALLDTELRTDSAEADPLTTLTEFLPCYTQLAQRKIERLN